MSGFVDERSEFENEFRKLYYLSKSVGIASFSITKKVNNRPQSSSKIWLWPLLSFCAILFGIYYTFKRSKIFYQAAMKVCLPVSFVTAAIILVSLNTLKRKEMMKLTENLLRIGEKIPDNQNSRSLIWKILKTSVSILLVLVHIGVLH